MPPSRAGLEKQAITVVRLRQATGWVQVTKASHPNLFECFEDISHDAGFGAGHDNYAVPEELADRLALAEKALAALTEEQRSTLAIGEESEQLFLAHLSPGLLSAHNLLHLFWSDWNTEGEEAKHVSV